MMPAAQAVEALISEYWKLVFHTIHGLTGDWEESQDLTQDTFSQAFKAIDAARAKSGAHFQAKAWLLRIALNTVRMQRRRQSLFRFIPFSQMRTREQKEREYETGADVLSDAAAPVQPMGYGAGASIDPETLVAERDAVHRTMSRLPEALRVCLLLSVLGDLSTSEIAGMLEVEEAAVRQRLSRARKQFQRFYAMESGEEVFDDTSSATNSDIAHKPEKRQNSMEYVESHTLTDKASPLRRNYAEGFYRDPALSPLW